MKKIFAVLDSKDVYGKELSNIEPVGGINLS